VTIEHLEEYQHYDWELISDIEETRDMLYFATAGSAGQSRGGLTRAGCHGWLRGCERELPAPEPPCV
jgi:hypothetical protein